MSKYFIEGDTLHAIGDAIRLKRDTVDEINPEDMPLAITLIESGGGNEPIIDEVFMLPERTSAAQTIRVNFSKSIDMPITNEMYMLLWEYLGAIEVAPQEKNLVFRKLETCTIHTNIWYVATNANVCNYVSTSGVISSSMVYGTLTNVSCLRDTYVEFKHPAIQTQNTFPSGTWRIRGWKMADAPIL